MVERLGQPDTVHRLHHPKAIFDELDLVRLEMPNQMPVEIRRADLLDLGKGFLHPVFAKLPEAETDRLADSFDRERLGHRDQLHLTRIAPGTFGTRGDRLPDTAEVGFQRFRHRSRRNHHGEEAPHPATSMGEPAVLFARAPAGALDPAWRDPDVFELKPKHGLEVEPEVAAVRRQVPILPAIARRKLLPDIGADLVAAPANTRPDENVDLAGPGTVAGLERLGGFGRNSRQRATPA